MSEISVVIIARNNEKEIAACLKSVKGADEIIVLDTGSTDKTVKIANDHMAKVFYHRWNDDFAEARNKALDYATKPWILSIDTDEELIGGIDTLRGSLAQIPKSKCAAIRCINSDGSREFYVGRVFRKNAAYWEGRIHEELNIRPDQIIDTVYLKHSPSENHTADPDRNIRILRQVLEQHPLSARDMFYLGEELYRGEAYDAALYWLEYYQHCSPKTENFTSETYYIISECYCKLHRANKAVEALMKAIEVNPEYKLGYERLAKLTKNDKWLILSKKATNKNVLVLRDGND